MHFPFCIFYKINTCFHLNYIHKFTLYTTIFLHLNNKQHLFRLGSSTYLSICYLKEVPDYKVVVSDQSRMLTRVFPASFKSSQVLAPKGAKHVYQVVNSDKTLNIMPCFNAINSNYMHPLVYPG